MIKDKKKFCDDLKNFFKSQGLTQNDIAERLGVSQSYIGMVMSGSKDLGKKSAQKWSNEFGLSVAWLLTGVGDMNNNQMANQNNLNGDNFQGNGMTVNKGNADYIAMIKKRDEQIDRLLAIIEKMQA